jgi:hypothetical protein
MVLTLTFEREHHIYWSQIICGGNACYSTEEIYQTMAWLKQMSASLAAGLPE